jgi:hypothetical protein
VFLTNQPTKKMPRFNYAIVRNIKTNDLYIAHGENQYTNLRTGVKGLIQESTAQKVFAINLEATQILSDYPLIEEMIFRLKMVAEK